MSTTTQPSERLQKLLARAGITSRRKAESMIRAGRVTVNGKPAALGDKAIFGQDEILVNGKPLEAAELLVYLRLYKPRGYLTALSDDTGRPIITELISDIPERVFPVGRLDYETEGLLLLTNDGELANALMHPSFQIQRTYNAKVRGNPSANTLRQLTDGVELDDGLAQAIHVEKLYATPAGHTWIEITLTEGRNREVRRMCEAIGHPVLRLRRVRFGNVDLEGLQPGEYQLLGENAVRELRSLTGNALPIPHSKAKPVKPKPKAKAPAPTTDLESLPAAFTTKRARKNTEHPPSSPSDSFEQDSDRPAPKSKPLGRNTSRPTPKSNPPDKTTSRPTSKSNPPDKATSRPASKSNPFDKTTGRPASKSNSSGRNTDRPTSKDSTPSKPPANRPQRTTRPKK